MEINKPFFFLSSESEEVFGDLYLDIAEAYMSAEFHEVALPLLRPLIKSERYSVAAVCWLRYGECLAAVDQMEEAAQAYSKVIFCVMVIHCVYITLDILWHTKIN